MTSYPVGNKTSLSQKHTSQIKSCYISLSGSYDRSFRIRPEKFRAARTDGEITMTSYLVGIITLLSRKPFSADKKVLMITIRKS